MWTVSNNTPFAADRTFVCDRDGAMVWIVVIKGTFLIQTDGSAVVADKQADVCVKPQHRGEPELSSLVYDIDLIHTKPATDIILNGHAYAPKGKPAFEVDATMQVAGITKTVRAYGDRTWERGFAGMKMTDPQPFVKMPIVYERAFGGGDKSSSDVKNPRWERRNPVGVGFAKSPELLAGQPAPNIEDPQSLLSAVKLKAHPAGFGPIGRHWEPRVDWAGTYDEKWGKERLPLLPRDFDERFYQCAPADQQAPQYLKGGEPVALLNLSPEGLLRFNLPRVWLTFRTRLANEVIDHHANLHTVILEPDVPRVIMAWHTSVPCHGKDAKLQGTTVDLKEFHTFSR